MSNVKFVDNAFLVTIECYKCHTLFAMTRELNEQCLRDHSKSFYCPSGHGQVYTGKTEEQKLRENLEREKVKHNETLRRTEKISSNYSRMRKRVANGVCPCCNRTFQNLLKHMQTEHPDFSNDKALKMLRLMFGLTQQTLAEEIGITAAVVSNYEHKKSVGDWHIKRIENWINSHAA